MKRDNGLWVPDRDPGVLNRYPQIRGVPGYQFNRIEAAVQACSNGRRAIDAGAHVGIWSLHLAHWFENVEAFEPVAENYACLTHNLDEIDKRRKVTAYPNALSSTAHYMRLTRADSSSYSWTGAGLVPSQSTDEMVEAFTIDMFGWDDVDLIKVDVEGLELEVLAGAADTIRRCRPVIIIEEKHDPLKRASRFLASIGMRETWRKKHDILFEWK